MPPLPGFSDFLSRQTTSKARWPVTLRGQRKVLIPQLKFLHVSADKTPLEGLGWDLEASVFVPFLSYRRSDYSWVKGKVWQPCGPWSPQHAPWNSVKTESTFWDKMCPKAIAPPPHRLQKYSRDWNAVYSNYSGLSKSGCHKGNVIFMLSLSS